MQEAVLKKLQYPKNGNIVVKETKDIRDIPDFIRNVMEPINAMKVIHFP